MTASSTDKHLIFSLHEALLFQLIKEVKLAEFYIHAFRQIKMMEAGRFTSLGLKHNFSNTICLNKDVVGQLKQPLNE